MNKTISKISNSKVMVKAKKRAPEISFGFGVVTFFAAIVVCGKKTLAAKEVLQKHREELTEIAEACEVDEEYAVEVSKEDTRGVYCRTAIGVAKAYGPVIALGGLSLGCFLYSNHLLKGRYLMAVSAYNAVSTGFEKYRSRVREEEGVEADRHYLFGTERKTVQTEITDEKGKKQKVDGVVESLPQCPNTDGLDYVRYFDETNPAWNPDIGLNLLFLQGQLDQFHMLLDTRGYVFLNEVLDSLKFPMTQIGGYVGWLKDGNGDGYIDFGHGDFRNAEVRKYINGLNNVIPLEFNVDGIILDKI